MNVKTGAPDSAGFVKDCAYFIAKASPVCLQSGEAFDAGYLSVYPYPGSEDEDIYKYENDADRKEHPIRFCRKSV